MKKKQTLRDIARLVGVSHTTVSQREYEMGDLAVQILIQSIEQKKPGTAHRIVLDPKLIIRESS
ncbi:MAG: hypothetical protein DRH90_16015 [Deltaproteobacteria bacterium]|nr:MAG: hypothetical protein DRH90_16015 [Deltaproteobacteria bacterium]RLC09981.1 MAG: hypothetical protein DRI24_20955 [Deltaproteobacteria bacterium]HHE74792.1 LacI family DNA-binding transcriptional regulator [Desulfobacteraceae bacterium]